MNEGLKEPAEQPTPEQVASDAEKVWREKLPIHLQPIAERHGQGLFQLVMMSSAINHALGVLMGVGRGHPRIEQATYVLQRNIEPLVHHAVAHVGKKVEDFVECRMDVERVAALMDPVRTPEGQQRTSPGGIILDS